MSAGGRARIVVASGAEHIKGIEAAQQSRLPLAAGRVSLRPLERAICHRNPARRPLYSGCDIEAKRLRLFESLVVSERSAVAIHHPTPWILEPEIRCEVRLDQSQDVVRAAGLVPLVTDLLLPHRVDEQEVDPGFGAASTAAAARSIEVRIIHPPKQYSLPS